VKIVAIVQVRMGTIRLPNKVIEPIYSFPMIELLLLRLLQSKELDEIIEATSLDKKNADLVNHVVGLGFVCY